MNAFYYLVSGEETEVEVLRGTERMTMKVVPEMSPVLRERVGLFRWGAVLIGFIGALIILRPGTDAFRPEALFIVAAAFFFALAVLTTRRISVTETNVAMYTYVRAGGRNEYPGITGLSHFFEHMMFLGTENLEPGELDKTMEL